MRGVGVKFQSYDGVAAVVVVVVVVLVQVVEVI